MRGASALASLVAAAAVALLLLIDGCGGAMYKVGDLDAWGIPPPSKPDVYSRWAKSIHFALGDSICKHWIIVIRGLVFLLMFVLINRNLNFQLQI